MRQAKTARSQTTKDKVVIAVHGIRTYAEWNTELADLFRSKTRYEYQYVNYWPFDALDLLSPFPFWKKRKEKVLRLILEAKDNKKDISVIAHSFGTYLITSILRERPEITIENLILCGSIVRADLITVHLQRQIKGRIINDCGVKDVWSACAELLSVSYGATGVRGIGGRVIDRFFDFGHSGFLNKRFAETYWIPLFCGGHINDSSLIGNILHRRYPWHIRLLMRISSYRNKIALASALIALTFSCLYVFWGICWTSKCDVSMSVLRRASFAEAACDRGERLYSNFIQDKLSFTSFIKKYEARWQFEEVIKGRPAQTPPIIYDLPVFGDPTRLPSEDRSHFDRPHYAYLASVSWLRQAKLQWDFRDSADEPGGVAYVGRFPIDNLAFEVRVPSAVTIDPCDDCETLADGLHIAGEHQNWTEKIYQNCRITDAGKKVTCSHMGIPAETPITYRFRLGGWNLCPPVAR